MIVMLTFDFLALIAFIWAAWEYIIIGSDLDTKLRLMDLRMDIFDARIKLANQVIGRHETELSEVMGIPV